MKPTISCKVYDEASFGDPTFLGYFEINLGFFSRVTKKQLIIQMKKLEEKLAKAKGKKLIGDTVSSIIVDLEKEVMLKQSNETRGRNNRNQENSATNSTSNSHTRITRMGRSDNHLHPVISKQRPEDLKEASERILQKLTEILKLNSVNSVPKIQHTCKESEYLFEEDTDSEFDIEDDINDDEEKVKKDKLEKAEEKKLEKMKFVVMPQYKNDKNLIMDQLKKIKTKKPSKKDKRKTLEAMDEYDEEQNSLVSTSGKRNKKIGKKVKLVEIKKPDLKYYRECGYDTISTKSKHYRLELNKPLEESQFKGKSEFQNLIIRKGKRINFDLNWFEKMLLKTKQNKTVGIYKGSTSCISSNLLQRIGRLGLFDEFKELDIPHSKQTWENNPIDKDILQKAELVTRVYILDGVIFENYDIDSMSDPYIKIILGEIEMDNKDEAINDQQRPIFNQRFE